MNERTSSEVVTACKKLNLLLAWSIAADGYMCVSMSSQRSYKRAARGSEVRYGRVTCDLGSWLVVTYVGIRVFFTFQSFQPVSFKHDLGSSRSENEEVE